MGIRIVVDSTADLTPQVRQRVAVVPLTVNFADEEFVDGLDITAQEFYEKLQTSKVLPTTSQASPYVFSAAFGQAVADGEEVIAITVSSQLSGTYQSARIAAEDYDNIFVVDSGSVTLGAGILAEYALRCADEGMDAESIAAAVEAKKEDVCLIAMLDTLEYLKKGGRISATVAFAGGLLNLKPVVNIKDGVINMLGKARGSKQGNNLLVQEIAKAGGVDFSKPLMLGYTGLTDALLQKYIADSASLWEGNCENLPISVVGSVVGTHVGPGAVAVAFFSADEAE